MRKKYLVVIFTFLMVFLVTGCGTDLLNSAANAVVKKNPYEKYSQETPEKPEYLFYVEFAQMPKAHNFIAERALVDKKMAEIQKKNEPVYLTIDRGLLFTKDRYVRTKDKTSLVYMGGLKDNKPDGFGWLQKSFGQGAMDTIYKGEFKDGRFNGYGQLWWEFDYDKKQFDDSLKYEGNFKDSQYDGKGNFIEYKKEYPFSVNMIKSIGKKDKESDTVLNPAKNILGFSVFSGEFSGNEAKGNFAIYIYDNKAQKTRVLYEGGLKGDVKEELEMDGEGITYYPDGKIKYKGNFKHSKFDGEGTLYDENGNKKYSGKWKDGDYAS